MSSENICVKEVRFRPRVLIVRQNDVFQVEFLDFGIKTTHKEQNRALGKAYIAMIQGILLGNLDWAQCDISSLELWAGGIPRVNNWRLDIEMPSGLRWRIEGLDIKVFLLT
jgi:hypothetical protein